MELLVIGILIFICTVAIIELIGYAIKNMRSAQRVRIRKRLRKYRYIETGAGESDIVKTRLFSGIPFLNRLLHAMPGIKNLDNLAIQANAGYPMGFYVLLGLLLGALGYLMGSLVLHNGVSAISMGISGLLLPFVSLRRKKRKRIDRFRKQLPDGLDLIARALKAGHAFTGGLGLAAEQFDDPLGPEFSETLDEINFGVSVTDALRNLLKRVECEELKYFVVGVILQRETGGNLAGLMETLANLIRERFKFKGKVRTLSAEGKISAVILMALPFCVAGYLMLTNPNYLSPLIGEPTGRLVILMALVFMAFAVIVMRKMIDIEV